MSATDNGPKRTSYDVVIVGGAMYGSAVASMALDLAPFHFDRITRNEPFVEKAVI